MSPHVALHGFGHWAPNIHRDLVALDCDVTVVVRPGGPSEQRARDAGVTLAHDTPEGVDGILVATTSVSHAEVVERELRHGVPIFVEKPLTTSSGDARRFLDRPVYVMDKWRYHPGVEALRDLAELGAPHGVTTTRDGRITYENDTDSLWRNLPHDLTIALEILGGLPPATAAVAEHAGGRAVGLQGVLRGDGPWVTVRHSSVAPAWRREVRVSYEHGTAWLADGYDDHIGLARGTGEPEQRPIDQEWPLKRELRAFLEHLQGGPPPRSSAAEGLLVVERIEQLRALAGLDA